MQNINTNKRIYLSGGGDETQSSALDNFFFNTFPSNGRFLYVPVALRGHKLYRGVQKWMEKVVGLHKREDVQFEIVDNLSKFNLEELKEFDGVYIGGGNTWSLMKEFRDFGFADILVKYIKSGGCAYGGSAGAIILGKRIDTHDDENNVCVNDFNGLDLLNGFSVTCHFKEEQDRYFSKWVNDNKLPLICLPEEAGLVMEKDFARCVGYSSCFIYLTDGTKKRVDPEELFYFK